MNTLNSLSNKSGAKHRTHIANFVLHRNEDAALILVVLDLRRDPLRDMIEL